MVLKSILVDWRHRVAQALLRVHFSSGGAAHERKLGDHIVHLVAFVFVILTSYGVICVSLLVEGRRRGRKARQCCRHFRMAKTMTRIVLWDGEGSNLEVAQVRALLFLSTLRILASLSEQHRGIETVFVLLDCSITCLVDLLSLHFHDCVQILSNALNFK